MNKEYNEIDEVWANNRSQNVFDRLEYFPTIGSPFNYTISIKTLFKNPKEKAVKKARRFAEKWNYDVIFYKDYKEISGAFFKIFRERIFNIPFLRGGNLMVRFYKKSKVSQKVLEDI